ncbi:MAG: nucleotidyl transferase AbiEii/AbiGii toxin family protein [Candidatus Omnitrophota bacterium]
MINFEHALKQYPERLRGFKENILKECLQYRILDIIYRSKYAQNLIFIGGTAIRIVYQGMRFSEDLDFDNKGMTEKSFQSIAAYIKKELELDGYRVDIKNVFAGAFHCYIRFPGILFEHGLSGQKQQRILIRIDAEPQNYDYTEKKFLINTLGIFRYINTVDAPLLLSQKISACLSRTREKGRDFFDIVYLMSLTDPDYRYLKQRYSIETKEQLKSALSKRARQVHLPSLAQDVEPFLFDPDQKDRIIHFQDWLNK